jgi:hypothetical protein
MSRGPRVRSDCFRGLVWAAGDVANVTGITGGDLSRARALERGRGSGANPLAGKLLTARSNSTSQASGEEGVRPGRSPPRRAPPNTFVTNANRLCSEPARGKARGTTRTPNLAHLTAGPPPTRLAWLLSDASAGNVVPPAHRRRESRELSLAGDLARHYAGPALGCGGERRSLRRRRLRRRCVPGRPAAPACAAPRGGAFRHGRAWGGTPSERR